MARQRSKIAPTKALPPMKKNVKASASIKDHKLVLCWMCLLHSGQIDFDAVGAAYVISRNSAQQRFYRLRTYMTMQTLPGQVASIQVLNADKEPLGENNEGNEDDQEEKDNQGEEDDSF
ncbi:hypothetical protein N7486_010383 [Penicillium sp. IBT 16267x]|nr:hypothetical protein N7486_010383 [Penicillium sp. IBT 16267x]